MCQHFKVTETYVGNQKKIFLFLEKFAFHALASNINKYIISMYLPAVGIKLWKKYTNIPTLWRL